MSVALQQSQQWTVDDLYGLPDNGMQHELLDGSLLVTPPPGVGHQVVCALLLRTLQQAAPPQWVPCPEPGCVSQGGCWSQTCG